MSEEQREDIETIRVLTFSSKQQDWDEWSQKFLSMAADGTYTFSESERSELKRKRKANVRGY